LQPTGGVTAGTTFSDHFGVDPLALEALGAFDPYLTVDTPLAIDPKLLERSREPELDGARGEVLQRFGNVLRLLRASRTPGDKLCEQHVNCSRFPSSVAQVSGRRK